MSTPLRHKSEVFERVKEFEKLVVRQFGQGIRTLRADNGGEYCNKELREFLKANGIRMENTAPHTPQQNGKAERENRTIVESARTMLHAKGLPIKFWAEAVNTAVYVLNRTAPGADSTTPFELWTGKMPDLSHMRIFGCDAFVHIGQAVPKKDGSKIKKMILVGYQENSTNYRLYDPITRKVITSRDVIFNEESRAMTPDDSKGTSATIPFSMDEHNVRTNRPESSESQISEAQDHEDLQEGGSPRTLRDRGLLRPPVRYEANCVTFNTPVSFRDAISGQNAEEWSRAINSELEAHKRNEIWTIVSRTQDQKLIDSTWVFKIVQNEDGSINKYKARLCARGFMQKHGLDYTETFAPVVRYDSLRVLLALIAFHDLEVAQFDVRTAFLYGELRETIYMKIPEGLNVGTDAGGKLCMLRKSLYGLKQAARCWSERFRRFVRHFKFKECDADMCIFHGQVNNENVYLALFVDDGLIAAKSRESIDVIIAGLRDSFEITINDARTFVGLQIGRNRDRRSLFIHQRAYTEKIIRRFDLQGSKTISIPSDPHVTLTPANPSDGKSVNFPFREAVGCLMILAIVSRTDIAFAVGSVSRFLSCYNASHCEAVKRIFKYLSGDHRLRYRVEI